MPPSPKVSRIAVLPFKPIVAESRNEALELGMSDALIDKLNGAEGIAVTPLSSVRRFSSLDQDAAAAGRELNVDAVLDGGVQTSGDRLRISARLLQVSDGRQLWAQQFDEKFTDIFAVQDSISQRVADALKARLGAAKRYTENVEAYALYLKARYLSQRASLKEIRTAIGYLEQALQLDPDYAPAYVVLADAYRATVLIGDEDPAVAMPQAKTAALRAVSIDAGYAEGHAVLGWTIFWYDRDWDKAESELKRALEIDPESSDARQYYAHLLSNTGRHDEAVAEIDKALTLEPLSLRANAFRGIFLFNAGRLDEAIAQLRKTLELQSDFYLARMFLARALNARGDAAEALSVIRGTRVEARTAEHRSLEAVTLARLDRKAESERILNELLDESGTKYVSNYSIASIMAALGRNDEALDRLEKAHSNHDLLMVFLAVDPRWDTLRSDPRFAELVRRLKLP
jgi:serine/threonine-protein kinase